MFVAWRDLRFARGRFTLMGTVIVLITVLVGLLSGLTAGLGRENTSAITALPADHLVFSKPADGGTVSFTESRLSRKTVAGWSAVPGVTRAEPLGIATTKAEAGRRTAAVSVFGVESGSALVPEGAPVSRGAVLSQKAADELDLARGDTVTLGGHRVTVAAVTGAAMYSHTPVIWTTSAEWRALPGGGDGATVVALTSSGADLAAADAKLDTTTVTREGALAGIGSYTAENGSLQLMRGFLFAISALVIGAFFTVWTIQRSGDVAVLKALGASTGLLLKDALGQAVVLLALGTGVGAALVAGLGAVVGRAVPFVLTPSTVLLPALIMIALGAAGAALAIRRITSVDPLTALGSAR